MILLNILIYRGPELTLFWYGLLLLSSLLLLLLFQGETKSTQSKIGQSPSNAQVNFALFILKPGCHNCNLDLQNLTARVFVQI